MAEERRQKKSEMKLVDALSGKKRMMEWEWMGMRKGKYWCDQRGKEKIKMQRRSSK